MTRPPRRPSQRPPAAPYAVAASVNSGGGGALVLAPQTQSLISRFAVPPTAARLAVINQLMTGLVGAGLYQKMPLLYLIAAADSQAARLNWVSASYTLSITGAPVFEADRGYTGAAGAELDTGYNPSVITSPQWSLNNTGFFAWSRTAAAVEAPIVGTQSATTRLYLYPRDVSGDTRYVKVNATLNVNTVVADGSGLWHCNRADASNVTVDRNGVNQTTDANASTAVAQGNILLLNTGTTQAEPYTGQIACFGYGGSMNQTERTTLYNILQTYMTAVGA